MQVYFLLFEIMSKVTLEPSRGILFGHCGSEMSGNGKAVPQPICLPEASRLQNSTELNKPMLNGKEFKMLWNTGSMISLMDRRWVQKNFPDEKLHSVSNFLEEDEGGGEGFLVSVVVASRDIAEPILGYNFIEDLILRGIE